MIQEIFSETGISIDYEERIIVKEVDFIFNLVILLQNTPTETLGTNIFDVLKFKDHIAREVFAIAI